MHSHTKSWIERSSYVLVGAVVGATFMYFFTSWRNKHHHNDMVDGIRDLIDSTSESFDATVNEFKDRSYTIYPISPAQSAIHYSDDQPMIVNPLEASRNAISINDADDYRDFGLDNSVQEIEVVVTPNIAVMPAGTADLTGESLDNDDELGGQTAVRDFGLADEVKERE